MGTEYPKLRVSYKNILPFMYSIGSSRRGQFKANVDQSYGKKKVQVHWNVHGMYVRFLFVLFESMSFFSVSVKAFLNSRCTFIFRLCSCSAVDQTPSLELAHSEDGPQSMDISSPETLGGKDDGCVSTTLTLIILMS